MSPAEIAQKLKLEKEAQKLRAQSNEAAQFPQEIDSPEFNAALEEHERLAALKTHIKSDTYDYMSDDNNYTINTMTSKPPGSEWTFFDYMDEDTDYSTLMKKDENGNWRDFEGNIVNPYQKSTNPLTGNAMPLTQGVMNTPVNRKTANGDPTMHYEGLDQREAGSLFERMFQGMKSGVSNIFSKDNPQPK